jgi:tetratricopeptide (TPR) repeat protein
LTALTIGAAEYAAARIHSNRGSFMRGARGTLLVACSALLAFQSHASLPKQPDDPTQSEDVQTERSVIEQAFTQARNGDERGAYTALQAAIDAPAFGQINESAQHQALYLTGALALNQNDYKRAHEYFQRSSSMPGSAGEDWFYRFEAAYQLDDTPDAALSLSMLAAVWPETAARIKDEAVLRVANEAYKLPDRQISTRLLNALFNMHWTMEGGIEPSALWRKLATLCLQSNDMKAAMAAVARVTDPYTLVDMRADNRFQAMIKSMPARFDVGKAALDKLVQIQHLADANPRSLYWLMELTYAMLELGRFEEVLKLTDQVIAQAKPQEGQKPAFDDMNNLIWIMDSRARALRGLKRWDEAIAQLLRAGRRPERGDLNVSQAINLGILYYQLDRPDDALEVIEELGDLSPYGRMQVAKVKLVAAVEKQDAAGVDKALQYLRDHQSDAPSTLLEGLLYTDRLDEASQMLQSWLADPILRANALAQVQQFAHPPHPPRQAQADDRFEALCARPEVRDAIAKVGKVGRYEIYESLD